jgi:uncharacterized repeat protein (TIGR03943 family)
MNRGFLTVPLLAWAVWTAWLAVRGGLEVYLHPAFRPVAIAMAVVLAMMAVVLLGTPSRGAAMSGHRPFSRFGRWVRLLVLILPVAVGVWINPRGYSVQTVLNRGIQKNPAAVFAGMQVPEGRGGGQSLGGDSASDAVDRMPLPGQTPESLSVPADDAAMDSALPNFFEFIDRSDEGAWRLELLDLMFASQAPSLRRILEQERVEMIGQVVVQTPGATAERFSLVRLLMVCCAADARPLGIWVERQGGASGFEEMDWVKVVARPTFPVLQGHRVPVLQILHIEPASPPEDIFLFQ